MKAVGVTPCVTVRPLTTWPTRQLGDRVGDGAVARGGRCGGGVGRVDGAPLDHGGRNGQREAGQEGYPEPRRRGRLIMCFLSCTGGPVAPAQMVWLPSLTSSAGEWLSAHTPSFRRALLGWCGEQRTAARRVPADQPEAHRGRARAALIDVTSYDVTLDLDRGDGDLRFGQHDRPGVAGRTDVPRGPARGAELRDGQRTVPSTWRCSTAGRVPIETEPGDEPGGRRRGDAVPQRRRGAAPHRRPGRRAPLRLRDVVHGRRAQHLRLLRPARPQGAVHAARASASRLGRHRQLPRDAGRARPVGARRHPAAVDVLRHPGRRALPRGPRRARRHPARPQRPRLDRRSTSTPTPRSCSR